MRDIVKEHKNAQITGYRHKRRLIVDVIKSRIIKPNAEYRHIINWRNMIDIIISRVQH
jgi:hypothetical protein